MIIEKANEQNAAVTADTDILAAAITPSQTASLFRIMVAMSAVGVLKAHITKAGNSQVKAFNSGEDLTIEDLYAFEFLVHAGDSVNFQYSANATLRVMRVQEVIE